MHAAFRGPAHAHARAHLRPARVGPDRHHAPDRFMSRNDGIAREAPLVVDDREVRVAHAAVLDRDLHLFGSERTWIILMGHEWLSSLQRRPTADLRHRDPFQPMKPILGLLTLVLAAGCASYSGARAEG